MTQSAAMQHSGQSGRLSERLGQAGHGRSPIQRVRMFEALHDLIAFQAMQRPDNVALVDKSDQLTYRTAWQETVSLAAGLRSLGLARNDRLADRKSTRLNSSH